jgi:hypothetical protein
MPTTTLIAMWMPVLPASLWALLRLGWRARAQDRAHDRAAVRAHVPGRPGTALARGEVSRLRLAAGAQLCALEGVIWLTVPGDARDHILHAGATWSPAAPVTVVTVVIEAVGGAARFSCRCVPAPPGA